jgi:drug/metabolite transporter (DMT)-like permease
VGFVATSGAVTLCWHGIDARAAMIGLVMGALAAAASILQVVAYRCAPASLIAPFSYAQILWAIGIGWLSFGTVPGPAMLAGSAIVIASGCGVAWAERARPARPRGRSWGALRRELGRLHPASQSAA